MQTPRGRLFFLSSGLHRVILDHCLLPAGFPLQKFPFARLINPVHLSRYFKAQTRGAHDLTNRYKSLESNVWPQRLRKEVKEERECPPALRDAPISPEPSQRVFLDTGVSALQMERITIKGKSILRPKPISFHGIPIPSKPPPPASDDCCMSSCAICVYDLYADALGEYQDAMVTAREQLTAKSIPKSEWPIEILSKEDQELRRDEERTGGVEIGRSLGVTGGVEIGRSLGVTGESEKDKQMAVVIGAFVEFEKALREKKRERERQDSGTS